MHIKNKFFKIFTLLAVFCVAGGADAATPQNSRAAVNSNVAPARAEGRQVTRGAPSSPKDNVVVSRVAMSRPSTTMARSGAIINSARVSARSATPVVARGARSATNVLDRNATNTNRSNVSRAAMSRATAVFNDVSKIGGGYAQCREAYATCMDQFCAKANDTYRRCFCSERFTEFRDTEDALDQARILLQQFEDNNLNAVDKTAAEVDAMYSATVGEAAIKNDTSGAAKLLAEIGDLISGKKKATPINSSSLGVLSLDFSSDVGDVFGGGDVFSSSSSIFDGASGVDLTTLEGEDLFNHVHRQCMSMVADSCNGNAVANMAKSAYGIMISQDCNAYEKSVDAKRQQVQNTVRQAEKILREARLEEYRAHNSQDVNECLDKVRSAMLADTACGANYKRCLDYTGAYINQSTGDAIYTPRLFELENLISLEGAPSSSVANANTDILSMNAGFNTFLDSRKMFATTALDTCRDKADLVWNEFKRAAIIEIAQAQDEKIEEVKNSCVETMRDCYDTQSNALKSFDNNTAQETGAISAYAARQMCADKVTACAALYSNGGDACQFDGNGKLVAGEGGNTAGRCGLAALLNFVDTVDTVRIAEGCETAITTHLKKLCTPTSGDMEYPWNCRLMPLGDMETREEKTLAANIAKYVEDYCVNSKTDDDLKNLKNLDDRTKDQMNRVFNNIKDELSGQLADACADIGGVWALPNGGEVADAKAVAHTEDVPYMTEFYKIAYGGDTSKGTDFGYCIQNTIEMQCNAQDVATGGKGYAKYNETTKKCDFSQEWYENRCNVIGGYWGDGTCYIAE